ncbi:dihydrodipicolinate synthetase family domain-containing protein [Phthorimaea operculella]|nr:dihydrodipicolinate synthetase family domain-containing protein [Phthorimaea operculella]
MVSFDIQGVIAPVFTPIDSHGKLNLSVIPEYAQYLTKHDIRAVLVGGTTGEAVTLSLEERKSILDAWLNKAKPLGVKVIAQIGGVPYPEVIEMARYAETRQADCIMTLPEIYYKPSTTEGLVQYLEEVSAAAPSLPLLYYHFPMMSGVDVKIPEFFKLASSRIPNFKGMKADLSVAVQVADMLGEDQRIFNGNHMIAPAVLLGHESSIATVTNMFPDLVLEIVGATKAGDVELVRKLQGKMNKLVAGIASQGDFLPCMKAAMPLVTGIQVGQPRRPMMPLEEPRLRKVEAALKGLGVDLVQ